MRHYAISLIPACSSYLTAFRDTSRLWNETASSFTWNTLPYNALRSPDADVDLILGVPHVHRYFAKLTPLISTITDPEIYCRQEFGAAVSMDNSGRSLAIGSPRADYDKLGGNLMDDFDTYPEVCWAWPACILGSWFHPWCAVFLIFPASSR
jgi:hypothetical protein